MKTKNLSMALEALTALNYKGVKSKVVIDAQQELSELQRLVSVVKEFTEDNYVKCRGNINRCEVDNVYAAIKDICDIVGYSERA